MLRYHLSAPLLALGLAQAINVPRGQHVGRDVFANLDTDVKVVLSSPTTLEDLAKELLIDADCLKAANPSLAYIGRGEHCIVPQVCCGTSCNGKFCSERTSCHEQSTSAAPVQTGTGTTCYTTITTSVSAVASPLWNTTSSGSISLPTGASSSESSSGIATDSTIVSNSSQISSSAALNFTTLSTSASSLASSSSTSKFHASNSSANGIVPVSSSATSSTILSPPPLNTSSSSSIIAGPITSTNTLGQTIISDSSGAIAIPTGVSTAGVETLPGGSVVTFQPSSSIIQTTSLTQSPNSSSIGAVIMTTNSAGETAISSSAQGFNIPSAASTPVTLTNGAGSVITFTPTSSLPSLSSSTDSAALTTTDSEGLTMISSSGQGFTIPSAVTTPANITNGEGSAILSPTTSNVPVSAITTTNSDGITIISQSNGDFTIPTALSSPIPVTNGNGSFITFTPSISASTGSSSVLTNSPSSVTGLTATNSEGPTIIPESSGVLTIPTGLTQATTVTDLDGDLVTLTPGPVTSPPSSSTGSTSSSSTTSAGILPVTTSVSAPKATDGATVIPCDLWFFSICISWLDFNVFGWEFSRPPGIYPPGPPPAITFPPELPVTISVSGNLPNWPTLTIGPDLLPTYEAEPEECETESAELCLTSTSYGVSPSGEATVTTESQVFSTCATVYGCNVEDSSSSTTSTASCTASGGACASCFSWSYDADVDWDAEGNGDPDGADGDATAAARRVKRMPMKTTFVRVPSAVTASPTPTPPPMNHAALHKRTITDARSSTKFGACSLRAAMTFKPYPEVVDFRAHPAASSYFVLSQQSTSAGTCHAAYMYSTDDLAAASKGPGQPTYATVSAPSPTPVVNPDHVYELSILDSFFSYALGIPDAPTCNQFNDIFVDTGLLQQVFDMLPNVDYPDLAAVDRYINKKKAGYFAASGNPASIRAGQYGRAVKELQEMGIVAALVQLPEITTLFRTTHERLYQALGVWDRDIDSCATPGFSNTWAATYSEWMTSFLSSRASVYTDAASAWYQTLDDGSAAGAAVPVYTHFQSTYPAASFTIPVDAMASGLVPAPAAAAPLKRQAACTLSSAGSSASVSDTPSSTTAAPSTSKSSSLDFPTLSTGITTPSGSSCLGTTTSTQCNGSGGQSACVETAVCSSWVATSSAPFPTLSTGSSTPSGSSCVATATTTQCNGSGGQSACIETSFCSSWVGTSTSTTSSTATSSTAPTPTGQVYINIYTDDECIEVHEQIHLDAIGQCYTPTDSDGNSIKFQCFSVTYISEAAQRDASLSAIKGPGCFSNDDSDLQDYPDLMAIQYDDEQPFEMGSLALIGKIS